MVKKTSNFIYFTKKKIIAQIRIFDKIINKSSVFIKCIFKMIYISIK